MKRPRLTSVLGLALDGSRLEGVVLRQADNALQPQQTLSVALSLDPLTAEPELTGREIRNQLDAAEIRERACVVCLPLKWTLITHVEVPELSDADLPGFLQIEAERSFPADPATLIVCQSICQSPSGKRHALLAGIPRAHLERLEQVLQAAKLKPVGFSLPLPALQPAKQEAAAGVLALAIGETHVGLQLTCGGGVAALRALDGALELEGNRRLLNAELVAREARITLGQLPAELREAVRLIRIFGPRDLAQQLADALELRFEPMGLKVELVSQYAPAELGLAVPKDTPVSPALSLAAAQLAGRPNGFEFLPPKVTAWEQLSQKYASGKLRTILSVLGVIAVLVGALFGFQQWQLWHLQSQYAKIAPKVKELETIQDKIRTYRPWEDETVRGLTILRSLTEAFPQTGEVTAKTIEVRDLKTVTCTGTARSYQALLQTIQRLRTNAQIAVVNQGPTRGQAPALQFTFNFTWSGGANAN